MEDLKTVLFGEMQAMQKKRLEHQNAAAYSDGKKSTNHRLKRASYMYKEMALEEVIRKAGLEEEYKKWCR